ncbi:hypothetical protein [Rhodococcus koreensis]|uniref:Uncharacterized protein n=2 Tax=Rhodococcus koreensis TaxID=99653 RepID=A0A1H5CKF7_9NOCA|nr:hypothetical protein [Rhodococcus koreensis]QSE77928.1 hypothetical protein JWS14_01445 [Rhodococcus koreensis]SED66830.1 hypothetical protein SAMN04490239_9222 [Rhodococcus koreensis]
MARQAGWSWRAVMVAAIAASAVTWLAAVVIADVRRAPDADCLGVGSTVTDLIASRPLTDPIEPIDAVAVHDPWARSKGSVPFDNYYAIAMEFRRSDGSISHGVWGLGAGPAPAEGQALTANANSVLGAPLVSVDQSARQSTIWPDIQMFFPEDANAVEEAGRCLTTSSS